MPRGNDTKDAAQELAAQFGTFTDAEDLIRSHRARRNPELRAASLQQVDEEATKDLDVSKVDSAVGDDYSLLRAKVRGGKVVAVVEDKLGRAHKMVLSDPKSLKIEGESDPLKRELAARDLNREVSEEEANQATDDEAADEGAADQKGEQKGEQKSGASRPAGKPAS